MHLVCLDLEGVLVPEIWIAFSEATGLDELKITTRDEPDYEKLMRFRLGVLAREGLRLNDIQRTISGIRPLDGAKEFLDELRSICQVLILSDTFEEFAQPLMRQLGWPTLFCNSLVADPEGRLLDFKLRIPNGKKEAVKAFKALNLRVMAAGDSYNDLAMLREADIGALFRAPDSIKSPNPDIPALETYGELLDLVRLRFIDRH